LETGHGETWKPSSVALLRGGPMHRSGVQETNLRHRALQVGIRGTCLKGFIASVHELATADYIKTLTM
jgi:hypothetical protein